MEDEDDLKKFVDYIREKKFGVDTKRLVKLKSLPEIKKPVYCKIIFTSSAAVKPIKLNEPSKAVAFVFGHETSEELLDIPIWKWLLKCGLHPSMLQEYKKANSQAWLLFFTAPDDVVIQAAHWEGIIDYVKHYYPDVYMAVYTHAFRVRQYTLDTYEKDLGFKFETSLNDCNKFMSYDKLRKLYPEPHYPPSPSETRLFLYCQLALDHTFHGDGFCRKHDFSRGARLYILPNLNLAPPFDYELVPFNFDIPNDL